jgi:hypothetical protein
MVHISKICLILRLYFKIESELNYSLDETPYIWLYIQTRLYATELFKFILDKRLLPGTLVDDMVYKK